MSGRSPFLSVYGRGLKYIDGNALKRSNVRMKRLLVIVIAIIMLVPALFYGAVHLADRAYGNSEYRATLWVYRPLATLGINYFQKQMGSLYLYGQGVEQNYQTAASWFLGPAEEGDTQAQAVLGLLYMTDMLGTRDLKKSFEWYYKSANGGNQNAQSFVAMAYATGEGTEADRIQAYKWLLIVFGGNLLDAHKKNMMSLKEMKPLFEQITPTEVTKARKEAHEWLANFRKSANR